MHCSRCQRYSNELIRNTDQKQTNKKTVTSCSFISNGKISINKKIIKSTAEEEKLRLGRQA